MRKSLLLLPLLFLSASALASDFPQKCVFDEDPMQCTYFTGMKEPKMLAQSLILESGQVIRHESCATTDFAWVWEEDDLPAGHYTETFAFQNAQGEYVPVPGTYAFDIIKQNGQMKASPKMHKVKVQDFQDPNQFPTCDPW